MLILSSDRPAIVSLSEFALSWEGPFIIKELTTANQWLLQAYKTERVTHGNTLNLTPAKELFCPLSLPQRYHFNHHLLTL